MDRRSVVKLGLAGLAMGAVRVPAAFGQTKLVLKATDVHPLGYPTVEAVVRMGKKLEAATNGRISVQMYPSMQLGGEKEMIEQAQVGALQIARISVGPMGPIVPELNVFNLPFMFRDNAHMEKVIDGADRRRDAEEALRSSDRRPDRPVLDERRQRATSTTTSTPSRRSRTSRASRSA